tara:strand:+ start:145 stop:411 length:267 start_codon:yes stop_codon:yes gene_type:complete
MDELLLLKLKNNLKKTDNTILNEVIIQNYLTNINSSIEELNELLEDIQTNNISNIENKHKEILIEKKSMEPFIRYLMIYNTFLTNLYN